MRPSVRLLRISLIGTALCLLARPSVLPAISPKEKPAELQTQASKVEKGWFQVDPNESQILVHTRPAGLLKAAGKNLIISAGVFTGAVKFEPEAPKNSALKLKVKTYSLGVMGKHLSSVDRLNIEQKMHEKVLYTDYFPDISFESSRVVAKKVGEKNYEVEIWGDFSLHGVTRNIPINAEVSLKEGRLEARGEFILKQTDYKLKPFVLTGGALKVADEVKITFDMVAKR